MRKAGGDVGQGMESKNGEVHRGSMAVETYLFSDENLGGTLVGCVCKY